MTNNENKLLTEVLCVCVLSNLPPNTTFEQFYCGLLIEKSTAYTVQFISMLSNRLEPSQGTNVPLPPHSARQVNRNRILHDIYYFFLYSQDIFTFLKKWGNKRLIITLWRHRCQHTVDADDCVCWSARKTSGDVQLIRSWPACDEHSLEFSSQLRHVRVPSEERGRCILDCKRTQRANDVVWPVF